MLKSSNISPLKEEIFGLKSKLASVSAERTLLQDALRKIQNRINHDVESSLSRQAQNYESRLTELHSVIAELKKQLEVQREKIIPEESTEDENENEEDILVEQEEDQEAEVEDEDDEENPEEEEDVEEEEEEEQDIDGLPTSEETDVVSADSTSTSPSNSDLIDKDEEMMSTSKRVEEVGEDDGPEECQYQNDNDKDVEEETGSGKIKQEAKRRISVSRSRRRLLQTSHQQNNTRNNKPTSDETGRTDIKDKPLSVSKSLNLRDFEMSSWREVNPKGKPTKILSSSGNCSSTKKPLPLSKSEEGRKIHHHQHQQKQQQQQQHQQQQQQQQHREELEMIREKPRLSPDSVFQFAALRDEVAHIREEHYAIRETLFKREGELDRTRDALENIAQERDFLRKKVSELEYLLKQSPKKFPQFTPISSSDTNMTTSMPSSKEEFLMCKVAERVKLSQCRVTSPNPSSHGCPGPKGNLNHKSKSHSHNSPNSPSSPNNTNTNSTSNNNNHNNNNNNNSSNCHHHHHHHQSIHLNMNSVVQFQQQQHLHQQHQQHQMHPHKMSGKSHSSHNKSSNFITGQELVAIGNSCSSRIVEHLVQPLQDESTVTEMQQAFALTPSDSGSGSIAEDKMREFEIETERLNSRLEHLRSQNDVLTLNLEDAKSHSDRLTVLLGKYESNNVGHQIALSFSDQVIEAYDVLVALLESELGLLLANCRAAGIGAVTSTKNGNGSQTMEDDIDVASLLQRANENRMTAEIAARNLIIRMVDSPGSENNNGMMLHLPIPHPAGNANLPPWEDASSCSQTLSSASSLGDNSNHSQHSHGGMGSGGSENGNQAQNHHHQHQHHRHGNEEQRVRDLIIQLKTDREAVRNTLMELENWSMEPMSPMQPTLNPCDILEARKLDLETAVLMQELMAMREDRAELRAQLFLLEKEKTSLEFKLDGYAAQQDAYKARINHLKAEIADMQENSTTTTISPPLEITDTADRDTDTQNLNENDTDGNANNNKNGKNLMRDEKEIVLKKRIQDLATSLEKIIHSTNVREQQSSETENELKKANNILLETLEGVKRKYQSRVKKMEEQIIAIMERHSMQMKLYKDRVQLLEIDLMERRQHL